jgi:hypothetical protein
MQEYPAIPLPHPQLTAAAPATRARDIPFLKPFDAVPRVAQSLQLKHGEFMEQVSEVKLFLRLNPRDTLCHPVDIQGPERRGIIAGCGSVPGMRPYMYRPTLTAVVPSEVNIRLRGHGKDGEQFFLSVAQVYLVHLRLHWLTPLTQASQEAPAGLRLGCSPCP